MGLNLPGKLVGLGIPVENHWIKVSISPNPFKDILTYSFTLGRAMDVSVELYDMAVKHIAWHLKNQSKPEVLHSGELGPLTNNLPNGVYFARFIFDNQSVIRKVIKI